MGYRKDLDCLEKKITQIERELKHLANKQIPFSYDYFVLLETITLIRSMQSVLDNNILSSDNPYQE